MSFNKVHKEMAWAESKSRVRRENMIRLRDILLKDCWIRWLTLLMIFLGCKKQTMIFFFSINRLFQDPFFKQVHFYWEKESIEEKKVSKSAKEIRELAKVVEGLGTI